MSSSSLFVFGWCWLQAGIPPFPLRRKATSAYQTPKDRRLSSSSMSPSYQTPTKPILNNFFPPSPSPPASKYRAPTKFVMILLACLQNFLGGGLIYGWASVSESMLVAKQGEEGGAGLNSVSIIFVVWCVGSPSYALCKTLVIELCRLSLTEIGSSLYSAWLGLAR